MIRPLSEVYPNFGGQAQERRQGPHTGSGLYVETKRENCMAADMAVMDGMPIEIHPVVIRTLGAVGSLAKVLKSTKLWDPNTLNRQVQRHYAVQ